MLQEINRLTRGTVLARCPAQVARRGGQTVQSPLAARLFRPCRALCRSDQAAGPHPAVKSLQSVRNPQREGSRILIRACRNQGRQRNGGHCPHGGAAGQQPCPAAAGPDRPLPSLGGSDRSLARLPPGLPARSAASLLVSVSLRAPGSQAHTCRSPPAPPLPAAAHRRCRHLPDWLIPAGGGAAAGTGGEEGQGQGQRQAL